MPGLKFGAGLNPAGHNSTKVTISQDCDRHSKENSQYREQASRPVSDYSFEYEFDHDILPLSASVGLSLAILRVGRKLTIVVTIRTRATVPTTKPML